MGLIKTFKIGALPVIDGVVAEGREQYAIAIKKSNGNILLDKGEKKSILKLPLVFIRGIIALIESGILACKMLLYSAEYFDNEEKNDGDSEILSKEEWLNKQDRIKAESSQNWLVFIGILILLLMAISGFFILPVFISSMFFDNVREESWLLFNVVECASRIILLILYFVIFNFLGGIFRKIRQYHSAANKAINCFEAEKELSLANVKNSSGFHPRSAIFIFFLTVVICSIALIFIKMDNLVLALLIRLLVLILAINISFEISRFFGMFNGKVSRIFAMVFGMWIEKFSISEPDDMQLYVAITAVNNSMIEG